MSGLPSGPMLVAIIFASLAASRPSNASVSPGADPQPPHPHPGLDPAAYARAHLRMLESRYQSSRIRAAAERYRSVLGDGIPTTAIIASGITSMGPWERGGPPDFACGLYGTEWPYLMRIAHDARTLREFGRPLPTTPATWALDLEAQTYAGMRSYDRALGISLAAAGLQGLVPGTSESQWAWRTAVSGYSSGPSRIQRLLRAVPGLSHVESAARWQTVADAVVRAGPSGRVGIAVRGRWNAAYLLLRAEARLLGGLYLAQEPVPSEVGWYRPLRRETVESLMAAT